MNEKSRIMVVDDEKITHSLIKRILKRRGYEVVIASSGADALAFLDRDNEIDVILLDIMMPIMNGFDVLEKIKANPRTESIKVIMFSALTGVRDKVRTFSAGAADYIVKPFQQDELTARIETQVRLKRAEEALVAQKRLFENLVAVARATTERPTLKATLQNVLNVAATLTNAELDSLFLLDKAGAVTHSILARGKVAPELRREVLEQVMEKGLAGWAVRHRQSVLIHDTLQDDRWLQVPDQPYTARSALVVPIMSESAVVGVLTLIHSTSNHFSIEHLELMEAAADQMALALRNAQIYEEQRRLADRQSTLYKALRTVGGHLEPENAVHVAVKTIASLTGWSAVAVLLPDEAKRSMIIEAARGLLSTTAGWYIPMNQSITGRAFRTAQTQHLPDVSADSDYVTGHAAIRSELAIPLRRGDRVIGVLDIESDQLAAFDADDVQLAESLADAVALALDNARLFEAVVNERSRLQALIESSRDGIILISINRRVLVINATALASLGLTGQPEDWIGLPVRNILATLQRHAPAVVQATLTEMRRIKKGDEPLGEGEYEVGSRAIHWLNLPVMTGALPLGRLLVLRDVTEERLLEKMRDDLTHTMVHDLRNPLAAISMSLQLLDMSISDTFSSDQQEMIISARSGAQRMLKLVNAILDTSRLEGKRMPLEREIVSLRGLVTSVLDSQATLAAGKRLRLESDAPSDLPPAWVDARLIERVLQNLIDNAIKFTPDGGAVCVTLRVKPSEQPPQFHVSISDTGPGISPEIQGRLFQKFVTGQHQKRGSGLGLAFCKMVVEAHGGRLWVEDTSESGTTFTFTLPPASELESSGDRIC